MTAGEPGPAAACPPASSAVMALLRVGVPLSLVIDLVCGPHSEELMAVERPGERPYG